MSLFDKRNSPSMVFAESGNLGSKPLKNKDALREAFVYHELSCMSAKDLNEFAKSKEAKYMLEHDIISYDTIDRLKNRVHQGRALEFFACNAAKENNDERWEQLCALRAKERELLDAIIDDYCEEAERGAIHHREDFIEPNIPPMFRVNGFEGHGGPHMGHHGGPRHP